MLLWLVMSMLTWTVSSLSFPTHSLESGGFESKVSIPVRCESGQWTAVLQFDEDVDVAEVLGADIIQISSRKYLVTNKPRQGKVYGEDMFTFSFQGRGSGQIAPTATLNVEDCVESSKAGRQSARVAMTRKSLPDAGGGHPKKNYTEALGKSILFYDTQRSGILPPNNPIPWRGNSALNDCVVGGWYDAGDHVKFGLPLGATVHLLLWGMYMFKDGYEQAGQLDNMFDMIKWPLDYLLQSWNPSTQEFVAQIGDSDADHAYWGRPEDMTMPRPCYKISPIHPGADLAGEAAACMALGSMIFRDKGDIAYAEKLLDAAKSLYAFGKAYPGNYTEAIPEHARAYTSGSYKDEMCEGGIWLYRATNDTQYLDDAKYYYEDIVAWALFYEYKQTACQLFLYEETGDPAYRDVVVQFFDSYMPGQMDYTPCGMAFRNEWGSNRYAGNTAFGALAAAEAGINTAEYRKWAVEQINILLGDNLHDGGCFSYQIGYGNTAFGALAAAEAGINTAEYRKWAVEQINILLGDNLHDGGCFSYQIGYGTKYPLRPHHRASSCPDVPSPCSYDNLHSPEPSPHVLVGALVGGPKDAQGNYVDNREDYVGNEVAIDYNSGFHSALAGIIHLIATGNFPVTNNTCPCES